MDTSRGTRTFGERGRGRGRGIPRPSDSGTRGWRGRERDGAVRGGRRGGREERRGGRGASNWGTPVVEESIPVPAEATTVEEKPKENEANRKRWAVKEVLHFLRTKAKECASVLPSTFDERSRSFVFVDLESLNDGIPNKTLHELLYGDLLQSVVVVLLVKGNLRHMVKRGKLASTSTTCFRSKCSGCSTKIATFPTNTPQRLIVSTKMMQRQRPKRKQEEGPEGPPTTTELQEGGQSERTTTAEIEERQEDEGASIKGPYTSDYSTAYLLGLLTSYLVDELYDTIEDNPTDELSTNVFVVSEESGLADQLNGLANLRYELTDGSAQPKVTCYDIPLDSKKTKKGKAEGRKGRGNSDREPKKNEGAWEKMSKLQFVKRSVEKKAENKKAKEDKITKEKDAHTTMHVMEGQETVIDSDTQKVIDRAEAWLYKNRGSDSLPKTPLALHEALANLCRLKKVIDPESVVDTLKGFGLVERCSVCGLLTYSPDLTSRVRRLKLEDIGWGSVADATFKLMQRLAETEREQLPSTMEALLTQARQFGCYEVSIDPQVVIANLTRRGLIECPEKKREGKLVASLGVVYKWDEEEKKGK